MAGRIGGGPHSLSAHPYTDESLVGFIFRLAKRRRLGSALAFATSFGFNRLTNHPYPEWIEALAADARIPAAEIWAIANGPKDDAIAEFRGTRLPTNVFDRRGAADYRVCPECLAEELYHRAIWDLAFISVCPVHLKVLVDACRACGRPLRFIGANMFVCPCMRGVLHRMDALSVTEEDARGTKAVYGLLGDQAFKAEADQARVLEPFQELSDGAIVEFLYRTGLEQLAHRRTVFSTEKPGELAWEAHLALTRGIRLAENWPEAFFDVLDSLRRRAPQPHSLSLLRSVGAVERWLQGLPITSGLAIRAAVDEYRKRAERDGGPDR